MFNSFICTKYLDTEQIKFLISNSKKIECKKNTILFYQEDICDDILLLEKGEVSLFIYGYDNDEKINLYNICDGEQCIINTASAISQTPVIANAVSNTDIIAYMIPFNTVKKLMRMNEQYQDFIFSLFSLKFNSLTLLIEDIKFKKLDARILGLLIAKNETIIKITHDEIANTLNTSRVVVSRILKNLEKEKKLKLSRGSIKILV